jgi:putative transposase
MTLFKNKYRIESTRLKGWDYAAAGWYFVTLCMRGRECFFGDVKDGEMRLSMIGDIVAEEWQKTEIVRPNVELDEWVVMPNHIHGIIVIKHASVETFRGNVSDPPEETPDHGETPHRGVSTKARLKSGSVGAIIGQFKSVCTKRIWAVKFLAFDWQPRFFDHIIRDEPSLKSIRQYIVDNPAKWELDKNNPANLWM